MVGSGLVYETRPVPIVDHHLPIVDQSRDQTFHSIYEHKRAWIHTRNVNMAASKCKEIEKRAASIGFKGAE